MEAIPANAAPAPGLAAEARAHALAEQRRERLAERLADADAARARNAEQLAELREAVARVLGANTRLSVMRSEYNPNFIYRAIDIETGEIVREWPQNVFVDLVRGVREDVRGDVDAGLMLDRLA